MTPEIIMAILGAGGLAAVVPKVIDGFAALRSGRAAEEKQQNQSLLTRVINAERRFDLEADFRRSIEEWASGLVYLLKQIGVPEDKIPPKPTRKDTRPSG